MDDVDKHGDCVLCEEGRTWVTERTSLPTSSVPWAGALTCPKPSSLIRKMAVWGPPSQAGRSQRREQHIRGHNGFSLKIFQDTQVFACRLFLL